MTNYFGKAVAERYDESSSAMFSEEVVSPCVELLAELAGSGKALEFGIGTGRVALPLLDKGIPVCGIDLSPDMVNELWKKDRGGEIPVAIGDFSSAKIEGSFTLVYLVFNTIMNLASQAEQTACFRNAAAHLAPGGYFAVEVMLPDLQRLPFGETVRPFEISDGKWGFDKYDIPAQRLVSHHLDLKAEKPSVCSIPFRYVWPSELDLMAKIAGMEPVARWGGWKKQPFDNLSDSHVSVWRRPPC